MSPNRKRAGYDYPTDWAEAERLETLRSLQYGPRPDISAASLCFGLAALIFALACITGVF